MSDTLSDIELVMELKKLPGAISYDGDASVQVLLPLRRGNAYLRLGVIDDDVTETTGLWWNYYTPIEYYLKGSVDVSTHRMRRNNHSVR